MPAPAIRTQVDGLDEEYSIETALDCSDMPDTTRQEFKDETDVNKILGRYGVNAPMRPVQYGESNFDLDLQTALQAIYTAQDAVRNLPPDLAAKYPTWTSFMEAAYSGKLRQDLDARSATEAAAGVPDPTVVPSTKPAP